MPIEKREQTVAQILTWRMELAQPCTLEQFLRNEKNVSRRLLTKLKRQNGLWCNGKPLRSIDLVQYGDVIELRLPEVPPLVANAVCSVPVCLETADFVIYNKPSDMPVHPSQNHYTDTLGNCFCAAYPGLACRPVNRLDRNTSGLCLFAKSAYAANQLQYRLQKRYYAVVQGVITESWYNLCSHCKGAGIPLLFRCVRADGKTGSDTLSSAAAQCKVYLCCKYSWRLGERIRYEYIWHIWGIRWLVIRSMAAVQRTLTGRHCTVVDCCLPSADSSRYFYGGGTASSGYAGTAMKMSV